MAKPKKAVKSASQSAQHESAVAAFHLVVRALAKHPDVQAPTYDGPNFGSHALKTKNKIFAMVVRGTLVVKLPQARVDAIVASGLGTPFDANKGKPMREWVCVADDDDQWIALAEEARVFVGAKR